MQFLNRTRTLCTWYFQSTGLLYLTFFFFTPILVYLDLAGLSQLSDI